MTDPTPRPNPTGCRAVVLALVGVLVAIALVLLGVFLASGMALLDGPGPEREVIREIRSQPDVVVAVRDLARLETTSFHIERVIEMSETSRRAWGFVEARDVLLLVAAGDVTAGVDLAALGEGDVSVDPESSAVVVRLPAPEILTVRLDNDRTYVHSRSTDLLARKQIDLETRARQEAESTLRKAAEEAGIVERARTNTAGTLRSLLGSLGYDDVTIEWSDR